jgi:hypothetical protein
VAAVAARERNGVVIPGGDTHEGESTAVIDVPRTPIGMHPDRHASRAQHISILIDHSAIRRIPFIEWVAGRRSTTASGTYCAQVGGDA